MGVTACIRHSQLASILYLSFVNMAAQSSIWVRKGGVGTVYSSAGGGRDVLIIGSDVPLPQRDAVSQCNIELTEDDRRRLTNQGISETCCDDLSIIRARTNLDKDCALVGVEVSGGLHGKELSRDYILKQIASLMNNTTKPGGVYVVINTNFNVCVSQ